MGGGLDPVPGDPLRSPASTDHGEPSAQAEFPASAAGRFLWWWWPALVVATGIFLVSGIESLSTVPGGLSDTTGHALTFGGLALAVLRAVTRARVANVSGGAACLAFIVTVAYGATDEVHQRFVPGRFASVEDWIADAAGAAVALIIVVVALAGARETRKV
jgi:VanZ family protein